MNKRIRELAEQAKDFAEQVPHFRGIEDGLTWEGKIQKVRDLKFAELIVREVPNLLTDTDLSVIAASLDRGSNLYDFRLALESVLKKRSKKLNFTIKKSL